MIEINEKQNFELLPYQLEPDAKKSKKQKQW